MRVSIYKNIKNILHTKNRVYNKQKQEETEMKLNNNIYKHHKQQEETKMKLNNIKNVIHSKNRARLIKLKTIKKSKTSLQQMMMNSKRGKLIKRGTSTTNIMASGDDE